MTSKSDVERRITIGNIDITDHVISMLHGALAGGDYDGRAMYTDAELADWLLVACLAGIEIPDFQITTPVVPGEPEQPRQQYINAEGVLINRSREELHALDESYCKARTEWSRRQAALIAATRTKFRWQIEDKAKAMLEGSKP